MMAAALDARNVRRGMDVYRRDGVWVGSVLRVESRPAAPGDPVTTYPISSGNFDGERLGPGSTHAIGNTGPDAQRRLGDRAAGEAGGSVSNLVIGRWFGLLGRQRIDARRIVNVSMERVVIE